MTEQGAAGGAERDAAPPGDIAEPIGAALRDRALFATGTSFTLASATDPEFPLTWVNPAFTTTTGYSAAESIGRNCRFLQGPGTDRDQVTLMRQALRAGRDCTVVLLNYKKDGTAFWNEIAIDPVVDDEGVVTHFVGIQTDVTQRVQAGQQREAALVAERRARADADEARGRAETLGSRLALVAEATGLLASTLDIDESLDRLAHLVVPLLADWVVIRVTDSHGLVQGAPFVRHRDGHGDLITRFRELTHDGRTLEGPVRNVLNGGSPEITGPVTDPPQGEVAGPDREVRRIRRSLGEHSSAIVPLTARSRVVGTMTLVQGPSGRVFDAADLAVAADLGGRAGLAIDNARLYTLERATALTLQHGLLPVLPDVPGLALASAYLPAGHDSEVGGDWWDVFALPDGAIGLAVGDVIGHDLSAAAAMGQLRSVLRTCAWAGDGPATVLDRMDRLVQGFDMAQLATCFYARLERATHPSDLHRLVWSNAGHPHPVMFDPDGRTHLLSGGGGVPIGVPASDMRREESVPVAPGSTILLYTDGLIETRTGDIFSDMQHLLSLVAAHRPDSGPQLLLDRLIETLPILDDDVALLAVQLLPTA